MFYVLHCGGMPFNGNTIKEKSLGGSETAAYYLAKELASNGHRVVMFTNYQTKPGEEDTFDGVKYVFAGQPSQEHPLGNQFHYYAENTLIDVLIIQRNPEAFKANWQAKVKLWWLHDLALLRNAAHVIDHRYNISGILVVSEFHKQQIHDIWGIDLDSIYSIENGVDLDLYDGEGYKHIENFSSHPNDVAFDVSQDSKNRLLYSSRPERGLEWLVAENAIMEKLLEADPNFHLYVCGYDNVTPQMAEYYSKLYARIEKLPNCTNLGALTKQELADVMRQCDAMVYPTPAKDTFFEEVSCITAMECMAAGLPFISTKEGALPETCEDSGSILLDEPGVDNFVEVLLGLFDEGDSHSIRADYHELQLEAAKRHTWKAVSRRVEEAVDSIKSMASNPDSIYLDCLRNSDYYLLKDMIGVIPMDLDNPIQAGIDQELTECYGFTKSPSWREHYERYYQYEKDRGVNYGAENLNGNMRFEHVSGLIGNLPDGSIVLDYGCAHGHYTINLAKRFPHLGFIGIDINASNIKKAKHWKEKDRVSNVKFFEGEVFGGEIKLHGKPKDREQFESLPPLTAVIAAEVIEHVASPQALIEPLLDVMADGGLFIATTPLGAWEAQGYQEHWPWRAHVHHFDHIDWFEMAGHLDDYTIASAPTGHTKEGEVLGSYIVTFNKHSGDRIRDIDYNRKALDYIPSRQTLSVCMIVKNAEDSLMKTLDSVRDIASEIIIALDPDTTDNTQGVIDSFISANHVWPVVKVIEGKRALDVGFDEARNHSIKNASGQWIFWIDADEFISKPERIVKYLQHNEFDSYSVNQHHFSAEPMGVLKVDKPARLFRNNSGIRFFGVVHEHPETELNEGCGNTYIIPDVDIIHMGYENEQVRRGRFSRNIGLMKRDREKYPDRILGRFLWIRDLAQMCRYEIEMGSPITSEMKARAMEGISLWLELIEEGHLRMIIEGMEFYDTLVTILGDWVEIGFKLDSSKLNGGVDMDAVIPVTSRYQKSEHALMLFNKIFEERTKSYDHKYF